MSTCFLPVSDTELFPIALRAAAGRHALADEALQHVRVQFWRGKYDPTRPFLPWAKTVAARYCLDARKWADADELREDHRDTRRTRPDPESDLDATLDLSAPFCPRDRAAVLAWKPRVRFVLLAWHGLWDKLSPDDQCQTLTAVAPAVPFPVPDYFDWPNKYRTQYLARALACSPNAITQLCIRNRERLTALRFVRDLVPGRHDLYERAVREGSGVGPPTTDHVRALREYILSASNPKEARVRHTRTATARRPHGPARERKISVTDDRPTA